MSIFAGYCPFFQIHNNIITCFNSTRALYFWSELVVVVVVVGGLLQRKVGRGEKEKLEWNTDAKRWKWLWISLEKQNCPIWFKCDGKMLTPLYIYRYRDILLFSVRLVGFLFIKSIDPGNVMTNNVIVDVVWGAFYANDVMVILHNDCKSILSKRI